MVGDTYEHCDKDHSPFKDMFEDVEKSLYLGIVQILLNSQAHKCIVL